MQTGAAWSFLVAAAAACLVACSPEPPEGRLKCSMASDCPDRWFCRDNAHGEKRCYKTSGTNHDAGARDDAGRSPGDASLGGPRDAGVTSTGGTGGQGTGGGSSGSGGAKPSGTGGTPASGGTGGGASGTGGGASGTGGTTPEAAKWDSTDALWDTAVWN